MKYTLDATNKRPGRLATEVAVLLMGKNRTDYVRNAIPDVQVEVSNASKMDISMKMQKEKTYSHHTGYPGSLKTLSVEQVIEKKGAKEVLRKAVTGMLPKNKLRPRMLKRLTIND